MRDKKQAIPEDFPSELRHSDLDTPVPSWAQITRSESSPNPAVIAQVSRVIANTENEEEARRVWDDWESSGVRNQDYRRSVALLIDKIDNERWLDAVGHINTAWDGGFYFTQREPNSVIKSLTAKSETDRTYIECTMSNGIAAFLNAWNHKDWVRAWMETDEANAALHIGARHDGSMEVHLEAYNPLFVKGAPSGDFIAMPVVGSFNPGLFFLHRRWEQSKYAGRSRTSANFYHMMKGKVGLCF
ncbi:MAG TPA: hypothetical protein VEZ90_03505 [Blastocatellia bacterium]|nr:hypothetical protein [Blastocatellia bacterium]